MIFPKKKKNTKTHKVELGTLYDINKSIVESGVTALTDEQMQEKKDLIVDFIHQANNSYYMLLCNDRKDYTIFHRNMEEDCFKDDAGTSEENIEKILIDECLPNRGKTKSIELTENKDAVEIWISIDGESYCYYFFPYDTAIIEC